MIGNFIYPKIKIIIVTHKQNKMDKEMLRKFIYWQNRTRNWEKENIEMKTL